MTNPEVTIALPVFNGEGLIDKALDSILEQDVNFELIVSDDASTDRTLEILAQYNDPRLRRLENPSNAGQFGNLNRCIRASRTEYIQFFSHDDVMLPGYVETQLRKLKEHNGAGMVYNAPRWISDTGADLGHNDSDETPELIEWPTYLWIASHYGGLPASISSVMIRRSAFDRVGLFDDSFKIAGDLELFNRVAEVYNVVYSKEPLHLVRTHGGMSSNPSSAGPRYLEEEVKLETWFSSHWSNEEWTKIKRFRAATRGRYHLGWIRRLAARGKWGEAARAAARVHALYPLHIALWAVATSPVRKARPTLPAPILGEGR